MSISAIQAAKVMTECSRFTISNLQVQKILYLAHLTYMYRNGGINSPLIREEFEAWDYGPVVPSLYRELKCFGGDRVENIFRRISLAGVSDDARNILTNAVRRFSKKSPGYLVELTHRKGGAWAKHYQPGVRNLTIPNTDIYDEAKSIYRRTKQR